MPQRKRVLHVHRATLASLRGEGKALMEARQRRIKKFAVTKFLPIHSLVVGVRIAWGEFTR